MKSWRFVCVIAICAAMLAGESLAQQTPPAPAAGDVAAGAATRAQANNDEQVLRQRSDAYYRSLIRGDRAAARQYVAPDQLAQFENADLRALLSVKTSGITISPSGDTAVVITTRMFAPPYNMTINLNDHWKKVNGEWLLTYPPAAENPFGIKPADASQPVDEEAVKRQIEWQQKTVDPDQVYKAVEKIQLDNLQKRQAEMRAKSDAQAKANAAAAAAQQAKEEEAKNSKSKKKAKKNSDDVKTNSMTSSSSSSPQQP